MATMAQLRYSPLSTRRQFPRCLRPMDRASSFPPKFPSPQNLNFFLSPLRSNSVNASSQLSSGGGNGDAGVGWGSGGGGGGGGWSSGGQSGDGGEKFDDSSSSWWENLGILGLFIKGWKSRVAADAQFPFKVLMEELVGVTACVLGDMSSRPNFGLNELDFVFSTLVVGSILNFVLMYLLAPTISSSSTLPGLFSSCPKSHMFEPGAYGIVNRFGTFVYKGLLFAAVGFAAGLVGTAISNGLIKMRKKIDPDFETPNKPPPTVLNALTWALHMGISSNLRYQTLNGIEFLLAKSAPPIVFKSSVVILRCLNNVLGGVSFVVLARLTGSQSIDGMKSSSGEIVDVEESKENSVDYNEDLTRNQST
ncbi:hypothetical protein Nepgr_024964 [Nepenthes gracilis]|uniref:Protein RETICULATA-RELATED 3, chloroplastic n=1 Tax=Nepenthes gracilis TaxID=150966 RepID=A0AAD3T6W2_NEPGR|nr:hypothetical protein Nepgr_024964 [Nepenthes gracilis]